MAGSVVEEGLLVGGLNKKLCVQDVFPPESGAFVNLQIQEGGGLEGVGHGEGDVSHLVV